MADDKGRLYRDADDHKVQVASSFVSKDASGTPKQSPLTVATGAQTQIVIPAKCKEIIVRSDEDVWYDNATGVGSTQGCLLDAGIPIIIPVLPGSSVYFKADSAEAKVSVRYNLLG